MIYETRSEVDANKFVASTGFNTAGYQKALIGSFLFNGFVEQLKLEKGRFYKVAIHGRPAETVDLALLIRQPTSHSIACVKYGRPPSPIAQRRADLAKELDVLGSKLILRKDVDNIDKPLAGAAPAEFSANSDRLADNSVFQSHFALATEIKFDLGFDLNDPSTIAYASPLLIRPYLRHDGVFNSKNRAKDIDNLGGGVVASLYAVPLTSWLESSFHLKGEYLTDTVKDKQIFASEVAVEPISAANVRWPIELQKRIYFDEVAGGPSVRFDLSGRVRYGWIEDTCYHASIRGRVSSDGLSSVRGPGPWGQRYLCGHKALIKCSLFR